MKDGSNLIDETEKTYLENTERVFVRSIHKVDEYTVIVYADGTKQCFAETPDGVLASDRITWGKK